MNNSHQPALLSRTELLLGSDMLRRIRSARVIIFGVGGVGSWCAESLVRSGVEHLTLVDFDVISPHNCNRQLMATTSTIGRIKVEALRERLLDINPCANITALPETYSADKADSFHIDTYDFLIDAIDSLKDKAHLLLHAAHIAKGIEDGTISGPDVSRRLTVLSSMGAALRIDPQKVRVAELFKVRNDTLGRALRKKFTHLRQRPEVKIPCVYSEELPMENRGTPSADDTCSYKAVTNGSLNHITAIFGFTLAGLVLQTITKEQ